MAVKQFFHILICTACLSMVCPLAVAQDTMPDADLPPLEDISDLLAEEDSLTVNETIASPDSLIESEQGLPELVDMNQNPNSGIEREFGPDDFVVPDFLDDQNVLGLGQNANLERTRQELEEETRKRAFDAAIQSLLPLRPEEIRTLMEKFDRTQESVELPVYPAPTPKMVVENVSLDPGSDPKRIKLTLGHVTTLSLLDITGAKWPIDDISWAGDFEITETSTEEGSHMLRIAPRQEYASGNMSMRLLGLKTPVIFMLETNRDIVHYRFDAIIPERGPFADTPLIDIGSAGPSIQAGNVVLSDILQGIAPGEADRLAVSGADGRTSAYKIGDTTYVRTPMTMLSPVWSQTVSSADGMRVYAVNNTPVLLLSDKGRMTRVRLSERENIFE